MLTFQCYCRRWGVYLNLKSRFHSMKPFTSWFLLQEIKYFICIITCKHTLRCKLSVWHSNWCIVTRTIVTEPYETCWYFWGYRSLRVSPLHEMTFRTINCGNRKKFLLKINRNTRGKKNLAIVDGSGQNEPVCLNRQRHQTKVLPEVDCISTHFC